jgi:hypothetical protein
MFDPITMASYVNNRKTYTLVTILQDETKYFLKNSNILHTVNLPVICRYLSRMSNASE